uniref:CSON002917 protein n=1 Tax=Culicoides sonorensis TaxID=179676 RepID=A0A336JYM7_CULSO
MVYNENLKKTSIDEIDLYEPYLWTFKIKHLCYPIAVIFMIGDSIEFFLTQTNYFGRHEPFYSQVEIPTNYTLQTISLIVGLFFIYGVFKEKSTPIAIFLWTVLEVNILYVILYTYKSISDMVDWRERIKFSEQFYGGLLILIIIL